ncbi:cell division protein CrgA [Brevibacterium aurantiacum]|uniref:Cell division protein CrgA n=1 Tax=Brevibacterium aurantiacum TaxID=273384 RepID=A0A556CDG3_BREAU|nr:cell division protein CrgA [Brevibacterium aurantiacum]TSI15481.1 cell division protein CrgA [Brevibacterium aurantiacum]
MAKSNGRTQRPQRTSRNSSKANVETKTQPNDDVEAVEDSQVEQTEDLGNENLEGDLLNLDDSSDKSDVLADDDDIDGDAGVADAGVADADASTLGDDNAAVDESAEKSTAAAAATGKKSTSKGSGSKKTAAADKADAADTADESTADAKKTEKSEKVDKAAKSDKDSKDSKDSKPAEKSETTKGASAKDSSAKGSAAKDSSAKASAAKGSSAKRTSRSGNPAKRPQGRKTASYTSQSGQQTIKPNPRWFLPVLIGLLLIGLIWLVTFYVSQGAFPVEAWQNWNILIGFAFFVAGLIMSTRWR